MKNNIMILIIGFILGISVTVVAGSYNAKQITYTPNDNTWNVKNVSSALDNIKQTDKTQIANLQSAVSNKDATISDLNSQINTLQNTVKYKAFNFTATLSKQTIQLGFRANYIACAAYLHSQDVYVTILYNQNVLENKVLRIISRNAENTGGGSTSEDSKNEVSKWFTINDTSLTWNIENNQPWNGVTVSCFATVE